MNDKLEFIMHLTKLIYSLLDKILPILPMEFCNDIAGILKTKGYLEITEYIIDKISH